MVEGIARPQSMKLVSEDATECRADDESSLVVLGNSCSKQINVVRVIIKLTEHVNGALLHVSSKIFEGVERRQPADSSVSSIGWQAVVTSPLNVSSQQIVVASLVTERDEQLSTNRVRELHVNIVRLVPH